MIRGLIGRALIFISLVLSLLAPTTPTFGYVVAGLLAVAFFLCCTCQKSIWLDGWTAAHEHHKVEGHPDDHMVEYTRFLSRQNWT
jgi:hypothetical protein